MVIFHSYVAVYPEGFSNFLLVKHIIRRPTRHGLVLEAQESQATIAFQDLRHGLVDVFSTVRGILNWKRTWGMGKYPTKTDRYLVGELWLVLTGTMEFYMTFHSVGNGIIIPTDEVHHFSEGLKPPTSIDQELSGSCCINELMHDDRSKNPPKNLPISRCPGPFCVLFRGCYAAIATDHLNMLCTLIFCFFSSLSWGN